MLGAVVVELEFNVVGLIDEGVGPVHLVGALVLDESMHIAPDDLEGLLPSLDGIDDFMIGVSVGFE